MPLPSFGGLMPLLWVSTTPLPPLFWHLHTGLLVPVTHWFPCGPRALEGKDHVCLICCCTSSHDMVAETHTRGSVSTYSVNE